LFNVIFAVFSVTVIALVGYTFYSADNRVILADEVYPDMFSEARRAGLETGDRILSIGGKATPTFMNISQEVSTHPEKPLPIEIERQGKVFSSIITPVLDKQSLSGKIGVMNWVEPLIAVDTPESPADAGGLLPGDRIIAIDGQPTENAAAVQMQLVGKESVVVDLVREGRPLQVRLDFLKSGDAIGFAFAVPAHQAPRYSLVPAVGVGFAETWRLVVLSVKGIAMLFRGGDFVGNVSGPVRLTVMMGETATEGFTSSLNAGLVNTLNLMALISISLFLMNLLPIPVLDGGLVLFALIEVVGRRPIRPKVQSYVQYGGIAIIAILFAFALFSDFTYLTGR
jgi:regulator of sigma E protease